MEYLILGFFTGLSLILAIGAQNIFVIEQGLKKQHVFLVCLICSLSDLILIFFGIFLFHYFIQYFNSTIGYGSTFLFDKKDNVIFKLFATTRSIWDSDYTNNDFKLRSSMGLSIDFMSVIPISISYAIPIQKELSDKSRNFNFTIGTSF